MNPPQGPGGNYGNYPPQGPGGYGQPTEPGQQFPPQSGSYPPPPQGSYPPPAGGYGQQPTQGTPWQGNQYGGGYPPPGGGYQPAPPPKQGGSTGLIIGIVIGVLVLIGAVVGILFATGTLGGGNKTEVAATATSGSNTVAGTTSGGTSGATTAAGTTAAGTPRPATTSGQQGVAGVPAYPGLKKVDLPQTFMDQFAASFGTLKVEGFTTTDETGYETARVKNFYQSEFTKNGWTDQTSAAMGAAGQGSLSAQLEQVGAFLMIFQKELDAAGHLHVCIRVFPVCAFLMIFQKGLDAAGVIGFPGGLWAARTGITGINPQDTLVIVITGSGASLGQITTRPAIDLKERI